MSNITKHHCKQKWKRDDRKKTGVDFLVRRNAIAVHDRLETNRELVCPIEGRGLLVRAQLV